jgi:ParB family chromosome partitioning protein
MAKKAGLGRGLDALFADAAPVEETRRPADAGGGKKSSEAADTENEDRVLYIDINDIRPNSAQPRKNFDEVKLGELASSIKSNGVIQPLIVRESSSGYELVAGERRLRGARLCGLSTVPCVLLHTDERTASCLAVVENILREDLNMFEEAEAICRLVELYGLTQEEVAERLSCSQSAVANKLRLLRLSESQRGMILSGSLTERHARALLRLKTETARDEAIGQIIARHLNVAATEALVEKMLAAPREEAQEKPLPRQRVILRDVRVFYHAVDRALELVRRAGVPVETTRAEEGEWTELRIRLPRG